MQSLKSALAFLLLTAVWPSLCQAAVKPVLKQNIILDLDLMGDETLQIRDASSFASTATIVSLNRLSDPGGEAVFFSTTLWSPLGSSSLFFPQTDGTRLEVGGPNASRFNFGTSDWSFLFINRVRASLNNSDLFGYVGGGGCGGCGGRCGWYLWERNDGGQGPRYEIGNCAAANNFGNGWHIPDTRLSHMWLLVKQGTFMTMYRDGEFLGSVNMGTNDFGNAGSTILNIGDRPSGNATDFVGEFGQRLIIWNAALTANDAKTMFNTQYEIRRGHPR